MIQWYVSSDNVAASLAGGEFDVIFATKRLNRLRLDQREFEIRLGLVERALLEGVTISFEPHTGNQNRTIQSPHRLLSAGGDVNRLHSSIPHRTPPITKDDYAFFSTIVIDSSSASMATSASSLVTTSGGEMRTVLGPQPRKRIPRSNASSTMRSRS